MEDNLSETLSMADDQTVMGLCVEALSNINIKASQDFVFYYVGVQQSIKNGMRQLVKSYWIL